MCVVPSHKLFRLSQTEGKHYDTLCLYQAHLTSIIRWADGKVEPVAALGRALYQQFIEVLLALVTDVEQNGGVADKLLYT